MLSLLLMDIKKTIEDLKKSEEFSQWKKENEKCYLVHLFKMLDETNKDEWQIGYYNPDSKKVITFVFNEQTKSITLNPESETFKEDNNHIEELKLEVVKTDFENAMLNVNNLIKEKYSHHPTDKSFFILQKIKEGLVWNFTFITKTFHVLNIKIDAISGMIVHDNLSSVFEFKGDA